VKKVNGSLAQYESIKKVIVVPDEWSVESGELTPSLKLKRRVLNEKYKDAIAAIYRE
jgi:long-chain acyl-CoA synthetase